MKIILGSGSPRRKELLEGIVNSFSIITPGVDEKELPGELPIDFTKRISLEKAKSIISGCIPLDEPTLLITSDTIIAINDKIIGKPCDYNDAAAKLSLLNNRTHTVITGITLYLTDTKSGQNKILTDFEVTQVTFKDLSNSDINNYLKKIDYSDKAGSYAIQEYGDLIIDSISGSLSNVIGFPLRLFYRMLNEIGIFGYFFK